jgi:protein-tyrosine phosphatase
MFASATPARCLGRVSVRAVKAESRFVDLAGAFNCRDLGGLPTRDGHHTRRGVLYRSDALSHLDHADVDRLVGLGINTVVDLRSPAEVERFGRGPLADRSIGWFHVPLSNFGAADYTPPAELARGDLGAHYTETLAPRTPELARVIRYLAAPGYLPALFHCTAGKDRTGIVAALVLSLVGVEPDVVVHDYTLTDARMARIIERLRLANEPEMMTRTLAAGVARAEAASMHELLTALEQRYGGAHGWAQAAGITDDTVSLLRDLLVDD